MHYITITCNAVFSALHITRHYLIKSNALQCITITHYHYPMSGNNNMVYFELGRLPFCVQRKLKIFKYWIKLKNTDNCILKACYEDMYMYTNNNVWLTNIKEELSNLGLNYLWNHKGNHDIYKIIEHRILDMHIQNIMCSLENSPKCILYRHLDDSFCLQYYLTKPLDVIESQHIHYV